MDGGGGVEASSLSLVAGTVLWNPGESTPQYDVFGEDTFQTSAFLCDPQGARRLRGGVGEDVRRASEQKSSAGLW